VPTHCFTYAQKPRAETEEKAYSSERAKETADAPSLARQRAAGHHDSRQAARARRRGDRMNRRQFITLLGGAAVVAK
jgi:hypothetical protein